ncbi:hypothetical protein amrb99_63280 [Actinomadura sp. RB99]|uniref:hypothetical protein n=1 Tax=Actinomadura sp. RB99 TaxID=2691577 RepID=UPI0016839C9E|nr:hypothetical protein [Actinomadura sp. RB99]MBD2897368.1 hypothetical protein [Actinomadura sp. RB99]
MSTDPIRQAWAKLKSRNALQSMVPRSVDDPPLVQQPDRSEDDRTGEKPAEEYPPPTVNDYMRYTADQVRRR